MKRMRKGENGYESNFIKYVKYVRNFETLDRKESYLKLHKYRGSPVWVDKKDLGKKDFKVSVGTLWDVRIPEKYVELCIEGSDGNFVNKKYDLSEVSKITLVETNEVIYQNPIKSLEEYKGLESILSMLFFRSFVLSKPDNITMGTRGVIRKNPKYKRLKLPLDMVFCKNFVAILNKKPQDPGAN